MTKDYSQPDFYKFNSDSIDLIRYVTKNFQGARSILDLCSGCGILGIEITKSIHANKLTFVEIQPEFLSYLQENCKKFLNEETEIEIAITSFSKFQSSHKYDLIVCNPPYYLPGHGEIPKNPQRALARSLMVDSWIILIDKIYDCLHISGAAFLVLKNDEKLINEITQISRKKNLVLEKKPLEKVVILKLFRLNEK